MHNVLCELVLSRQQLAKMTITKIENRNNLYLEFDNVYSYLFKNYLNINYINKNTKLNIKQIKKYNISHLIKNLYIENILENHSKILLQSKIILKKFTNIYNN